MKKLFTLLVFSIFPILGSAQCWQKVSAGGAHTIAITNDGSLWAWGRNQAGQLGKGNYTNNTTPTKVGSTNDWKEVSAGNAHSIALKNNGTLWTYGRNVLGQLGFGYVLPDKVNAPTQIGTDSNWAQISAGDEYCMAIKTNGTLWGWGDNAYGQCGDGTQLPKNTPTQVGTSTNWVSVAAGTNHTLAIKSDGTLWAFGYNNAGQLGDATFTLKTAPVQIGTANNWLKVACGIFHSVALKSDGSLWTWGQNSTYGQLGDGTLVDKNTPQQVQSGTAFTNITKGHQHTLAQKANGSLITAGGSISGQLGNGSLVASSVNFGPVTTTSTNWVSLSCKVSHNAALKSNGELFMWGSNIYGQIGDGSLTLRSIPVNVACPALSSAQFNEGGFSIFPNPANDFLNIEMQEGISISRTIITDMLGKIVYDEKNQDINVINIGNLSKGIYVLQIYADEKIFVNKFVKN